MDKMQEFQNKLFNTGWEGEEMLGDRENNGY
jgi:hypothetical protein